MLAVLPIVCVRPGAQSGARRQRRRAIEQVEFAPPAPKCRLFSQSFFRNMTRIVLIKRKIARCLLGEALRGEILQISFLRFEHFLLRFPLAFFFVVRFIGAVFYFCVAISRVEFRVPLRFAPVRARHFAFAQQLDQVEERLRNFAWCFGIFCYYRLKCMLSREEARTALNELMAIGRNARSAGWCWEAFYSKETQTFV